MINFLQKSLLFVCDLFVLIFIVDQIDIGGWNYYFSPLIFSKSFLIFKKLFSSKSDGKLSFNSPKYIFDLASILKISSKVLLSG